MDSRTSQNAGNSTARFGNAADRAGFRQHGRSTREDEDRQRHRDGRRNYERKSYRDRSYSSGDSDDHRQRVAEDRGYHREKRSDHGIDKFRRDHRRDHSTDNVSRKRRERSGSYERSPIRRRSRSPPRRRRRRSASTSKSPPRRSRVALPSQDDSFRRETGVAGAGDKPPEKEKPNFKPTGLLAKEANTVAGTATVLKYHEPPEARKPPPKEAWRMYVFKKKDLVDTIHLHQRSCWLLGRDQKVTDLLLEHPSISKQHAVIQFRYLTTTNEYGDKASKVKPYLIDLESANGTGLNGTKIETSRFVELVDADVITFGDSEREYVVMLPSVD